MADKEAIKNRIEEIERRRSFLEDYASMDLTEFEEEREHQETALRDVQICIQACMDIAKNILASKETERPVAAGDIFLALAKDGTITQRLAEDLVKAAGFRNILVHSYLEIDPEKVHKNLKDHLADFDEFITSISKILQ